MSLLELLLRNSTSSHQTSDEYNEVDQTGIAQQTPLRSLILLRFIDRVFGHGGLIRLRHVQLSH